MDMILIFHIVVAIASLIAAGYVYINPSRRALIATSILVIGMLASGFYLTIKNPAHLTQSCIMGLIYLAVVSWVLVAAKRKLTTH